MTVRSVTQWSFLVVAVIATAFSIRTAAAVELNPQALVYKLPDQLQWRDPLGVSGVNQAVLQGDPTKPASTSSSIASSPAISAARISIPMTASSRW